MKALACCIALSLVLAACRRQPAPEPPTTSAPAPPVAASPGPLAAPAPGVAPAAKEPQPDLAALTQALRAYVQKEKKVPQSLDPLVRAGFLPAVPAPPAGKRFVIDAKKLEVSVDGFAVGF